MSQRSALRDVWAKVPDARCKGLCAQSCGPIGASRLEVRLLERRGVHLDLAEVMGRVAPLLDTDGPGPEAALAAIPDCPALVEGRCSVYDVRPTVCRLWGAVENMPCPWGCEPEGGRLSVEEGYSILREAMQVGGW